MGRQINFFMLDEDLSEIDIKIKELGLTIIADRMPTEQIIVLDSLKNDFDEMYLLFAEDLKEVGFDYYDNHQKYIIHPMHIQGLEFSKSMNLKEEKLITLGRIFYDKEYYDNNHNYISKNNLLTNAVDIFFKWFRNKYKQKVKSYPIGDYTYKYAKQNNFLLKTSTQKINIL